VSTPKGLDRPPNRILTALPEREYKRLLPNLEPVSFRLGDIVYQQGEPIRYVYFMNQALISLLITLEGGESVEVGVIGSEGILGIHYALGSSISPNLAVAQIPGSCLRMKANVIRAEFNRGLALHDLLTSYTSCLLFMVSQTVACNRIHRLEKRLSRWILMVRERVNSEKFPMTHEFMASMLGTPRSEVSKAAGALKRRGLIQYRYGSITILNQAGLESRACECYRIVREMYAASFNGNPRRPEARKS